MESIKEHFERISKSKQFSLDTCANLKRLLQKYIDTGDIQYVNEAADILNNRGLFVYSEINHLRVLFSILSNENHHKVSNKFVSETDTVESVLQKFFFTIFALRRIELNQSSNGVSEAIEFILDKHISVLSILVILKEELFMDAAYTSRKLFLFIEGYLSKDERKFWILALASTFGFEDMYIRIASEYMESGFFAEAFQVLKQIKNPSEETINIINELGKVL